VSPYKLVIKPVKWRVSHFLFSGLGKPLGGGHY